MPAGALSARRPVTEFVFARERLGALEVLPAEVLVVGGLGREEADMRDEIRRQLEVCLDELRRNALREESLLRIAKLADQRAEGRQDLLYLQAEQTSVTSRVIGMSMFVDGEVSDGPDDPDVWPYQTVGDALADGWRIVKFPEMAILLDDRRTYGLGCEFILEKWREAT